VQEAVRLSYQSHLRELEGERQRFERNREMAEAANLASQRIGADRESHDEAPVPGPTVWEQLMDGDE
jgi:hypothetical protein